MVLGRKHDALRAVHCVECLSIGTANAMALLTVVPYWHDESEVVDPSAKSF